MLLNLVNILGPQYGCFLVYIFAVLKLISSNSKHFAMDPREHLAVKEQTTILCILPWLIRSYSAQT